VELCEALEQTASGKVRKDVLRQKVRAAMASESSDVNVIDPLKK